MYPKYKPKTLFIKGYNYSVWLKNEEESTDKEESIDIEESTVKEESTNKKGSTDLSGMSPLKGDEEELKEGNKQIIN